MSQKRCPPPHSSLTPKVLRACGLLPQSDTIMLTGLAIMMKIHQQSDDRCWKNRRIGPHALCSVDIRAKDALLCMEEHALVAQDGETRRQ